MTRVVLVGGKRHGQWYDMPEPLPADRMVPWPIEPATWTYDDEATMFDDLRPKADLYYQINGTLLSSGVLVETVYYMALEAMDAMRWLWIATAFHVARCPGLCAIEEMHDRPPNMPGDFIRAMRAEHDVFQEGFRTVDALRLLNQVDAIVRKMEEY